MRFSHVRGAILSRTPALFGFGALSSTRRPRRYCWNAKISAATRNAEMAPIAKRSTHATACCARSRLPCLAARQQGFDRGNIGSNTIDQSFPTKLECRSARPGSQAELRPPGAIGDSFLAASSRALRGLQVQFSSTPIKRVIVAGSACEPRNTVWSRVAGERLRTRGCRSPRRAAPATPPHEKPCRADTLGVEKRVSQRWTGPRRTTSTRSQLPKTRRTR